MIERLSGILFAVFYVFLAATFVCFNLFLARLGILRQSALDPVNVLAFFLLLAGLLIFFVEKKPMLDRKSLVPLKLLFAGCFLLLAAYLIGMIETLLLNL